MLGINTVFFGRNIQTKASTLLQLLSCRKGKLWVLHSSGEELGFLESPGLAPSILGLNCVWIKHRVGHPSTGLMPGVHSSQPSVGRDTNLCCWEAPVCLAGSMGFLLQGALSFLSGCFSRTVSSNRTLVNFLVRIQLVLWSLRKHSLSHQRLRFGNLCEDPKAPPFQDWNKTWNHVYAVISQQVLVLASLACLL